MIPTLPHIRDGWQGWEPKPKQNENTMMMLWMRGETTYLTRAHVGNGYTVTTYWRNGAIQSFSTFYAEA